MAEFVSIASGIAGLITLSTAVLAARYEFISTVSSASEDFKGLVRETAYLSTLLSQLISHSLSEQAVSQIASHTLIRQGVLQDCENVLRNIQSLICDCEYRNSTMNALLWPLKQKEIVKNRERLSRLYSETACSSSNSIASIKYQRVPHIIRERVL
jgi:hypothetical protein